MGLAAIEGADGSIGHVVAAAATNPHEPTAAAAFTFAIQEEEVEQGRRVFFPQGSSTRHAGAAAAATPPRRPPPLLCHHPRLGGRVKETLDASRSEIFSPASRDGGRSAMNRRMHITRSTEFSLSWTNEVPRKGGALTYRNRNRVMYGKKIVYFLSIQRHANF